MNAIWCGFRSRQKLPAGQCRMVLDLLQQLTRGCATFRFPDLPPELKAITYDIALENSEYSELYGHGLFEEQRPLPPMPNRVVALRMTNFRLCRTGTPPPLRVNHEMRSDAGKVYFKSRKFELFIDARYSDCALEEVEVWLQTIV
jgi:hypothetical protein